MLINGIIYTKNHSVWRSRIIKTDINLITRLQAGLENFSPSETRIANEIISSPSQVTGYSSQALAKNCNVSQSAIVKFCQKLGYKGYTALKLALNAELARGETQNQVHRNIFSDDPMGEVAKKLFDSKVSALSETMRLNASDDIDGAVELIENANRIIIIGMGGSLLVAQDLSSKLTKFGKAVLFGADSHTQLANLVSLTPDDLVIGISYSGKTKEIRVAIENANLKGIPVIAIFGYDAQETKINKGIKLNCVADENLVRSASIATRTAQFAVADLLFVALTQKMNNVSDVIQSSQKIVKSLL